MYIIITLQQQRTILYVNLWEKTKRSRYKHHGTLSID